MQLQLLGHPCFELDSVIALEYLETGEKTHLINVGYHISYVFHLFCSQGSGDFVSGSNINSGEDVLVLIPV